MGQTTKHKPVKLIIGFIFKKENALHKAELFLEKRFGKIDYESQILSFCHTNYYEEEFDKDLKRKFLAFKKLISPETLSRIKIITNKLENKLSKNNHRLINIDPGYLNLGKVVLATTKDYTHRVYLKSGIYLEVTLFYRDGSFKPWEWTYPDYKTNEYIAIFNKIRQIYAIQIKEK